MCYKIVYKSICKIRKKRIKAKFKNPPKTGKNTKKNNNSSKTDTSSVANGGWVFLKSLFYVLHLTITVEYKMIGANLIICGQFEFCQN